MFVDEKWPDVPAEAWFHHCGHLNPGAYDDSEYTPVCQGCRFEVPPAHANRGDILLVTLTHYRRPQ